MKINTWFCVNLGDANISQLTLCELKQSLTDVFNQNGQPKNMLAVYRYEAQSVHCQTKLFLSESFQKYLKLENAQQCPAPDFNNVEYLVGNKNYMC